jgi:hypothetical protein
MYPTAYLAPFVALLAELFDLVIFTIGVLTKVLLALLCSLACVLKTLVAASKLDLGCITMTMCDNV